MSRTSCRMPHGTPHPHAFIGAPTLSCWQTASPKALVPHGVLPGLAMSEVHVPEARVARTAPSMVTLIRPRAATSGGV